MNLYAGSEAGIGQDGAKNEMSRSGRVKPDTNDIPDGGGRAVIYKVAMRGWKMQCNF